MRLLPLQSSFRLESEATHSSSQLEAKARLEKLQAEFLRDQAKLSKPERKARYDAIQQLYKASLETADQQVALAVQSYESVRWLRVWRG